MNSKLVRGLAFVAWAIAAPTAFSATVFSVDDKVKFADSYGASPGGAFTLTNWGSAGNTNLGSIETFCVEYNEFMDFKNTFKVAGISNAAKSGGLSGAAGGEDPLDAKTAYLYTNYVENQSGLNGATGWSTASATARGTAMQLAVWFLEGETPLNSTQLNSYNNNNLAKALVSLAGLSGWTDTGRVKILNIINSSGGNAQDQLYLAPVPLPAAGLLMISALGMGGIFLRRRNSKTAG